MTTAELFEKRKNDPRWNTSYPLNPKDWAQFRVTGELPFRSDERLSFYIHIPFCKQLCSFCEYTRMICPNEGIQQSYLLAIKHDVECFKKAHPSISLLGFDFGGGTPTSLSESNISLLMNIYQDAIEGLPLSSDYEASIEGTFNTLSVRKLESIASAGILRLSLGVQSSNCGVLNRHHRSGSDKLQMSYWIQAALTSGIRKVNLDFMYGLNGQSTSTIVEDLDLINHLHPQQVTLYELRGNMITDTCPFTKEELYSQYCQYYDGLLSMGYRARFGQNTFSLDSNDLGLSSYLRSRMIDGASYKGFGLSAQSMSSSGVSYNVGKLAKNPEALLGAEAYPEQDTYILPPQELSAKYLAISAYYGAFSKNKLTLNDTLQERLDFCIAQGLLRECVDGQICITEKGFLHYGAVFSLLNV